MTIPATDQENSPYENPLLSPVDVHHVAFNKPPIGQRGYNEDEVDQFLDLVEEDILRYRTEIETLRGRISELEAQNKRLTADLEIARSVTPTATSESAYISLEGEPNNAARAAKILELAQATVETYERTAKAKADSLIDEATERSNKMVSDATIEAERTLGEARTRAIGIEEEAQQNATQRTNEAKAYAARVTAEAEEHARALKEEAERSHHEVMTTITEQRNALEDRIDRLKIFENEYRTRLRSHIESHLESLKAYDEDSITSSIKGPGI